MLPRGGTLLFTASKTGLVAQTDSPVYCASKGAVVMLAKALALDYAQRGIRVNALCPGIIDTPMLREFADSRPDPNAESVERLVELDPISLGILDPREPPVIKILGLLDLDPIGF